MTLKHWKASDTYYPRGLGLKQEVQEDLGADYHSAIVSRLRESGHQLQENGLTIHLAKEFGFCYGVDRAVDYAYESRQKFPDKTLWLATEIIHNPFVNGRLREMGVRILESNDDPRNKYHQVKKEDVVLISAFGAPVGEMEFLKGLGCIIVDTTCGSVMSVWKSVESYARQGFTAIIHGKWDHEETLATCSRATQYEGGRYLVVRDKAEAQEVCDYIINKGDSHLSDKGAFLKKFRNACSEDFDPDRDLQGMGLANQTTMLSQESLEIGEMLRAAMTERYGTAEMPKRYRTFDTICSATQDRQDAVRALLERDLDVMIVIGGYNSSNTNHLAEISTEKTSTYHIHDATCLVSREEIKFKPVGKKEESSAKNWFPADAKQIGVTAGASTPDSKVGEVIERIRELSRG